MTKISIQYLLCLVIFTGLVNISCSGQQKSNPLNHNPAISTTLPVVINCPKPHSYQPDHDTLLVSQYIRSIFEDSKGNLWFGTLGEGIVRYDVKTLTYYHTNEGLKCNSVHAMEEDKDGNLWIGTDLGVFRYDGKSYKNYDQTTGLNNINISRQGIVEDQSGQLWVGTTRGLFRYVPSADTTGGHCFVMFDPASDVNVAGIMEDKKGVIWIVSQDKGVFWFDPTTYSDAAQHTPRNTSGKEIHTLPLKSGLSYNYAGSMDEDKEGNIWFTTDVGIARYDRKDFTHYTMKDGIGGTEMWGIIIEESGIIWITARGATTRFDPNLTKTDPNAFKKFTPTDGINCCMQSMYQDKSGRMWWGAGSGLFRFDGKRFYQVKQNGPW